MCFMVPAVLFGGITLVVEPLRALIDSLFRELRKRNINCEKLLSNEAAGHSQALSAYNRLCTLLDEKLDGKPLVILTTPELVCTGGTMEILGNLQEQGKLRRVVVDEFDLWYVNLIDLSSACVTTSPYTRITHMVVYWNLWNTSVSNQRRRKGLVTDQLLPKLFLIFAEC